MLTRRPAIRILRVEARRARKTGGGGKIRMVYILRRVLVRWRRNVGATNQSAVSYDCHVFPVGF